MTSLQLDGIPELSFRVEANDPSGEKRITDTIRLDLSRLRELADQTDDPVYVYPTNPYLNELGAKYRGVLRVAIIIVAIVAGLCAIVCIVLYIVERRIRAKLPAEFEENLETAIRQTNRRVEKPIFGDVPTEQYGYTVPIKLRNYGELTEEEAAARKREYQEKLKQNLREYSASPAAVSKKRPAEQNPDAAFAGTRIIPISRPKTAPPVRDDIKLIPVNPIEPDKPEPERRKSEPQKADKPVRAKEPAKQPAKSKSQQKPVKSEPKSRPIEPVKAKPEPVKPVVKDTPKPEPVKPAVKDTPKPEPVKPVVKDTPKPEPVKPVVKETPKPEPVKAKPEPAVSLSPLIEAPRLAESMPRPAKRPIRPQQIWRMNGGV